MKRYKRMHRGAWLCLLLCLTLLLFLPLRAAAEADGAAMSDGDAKAAGDTGETVGAADESGSVSNGGDAGETVGAAGGNGGESNGGETGKAVGENGGKNAGDAQNASGLQNEAVDPADENASGDVPVSDEKEGGSSENPTFSDRIVRFFGDNCAEMLSALTLVSSLAIALLFKKGLLPALSSALKGLAGGLSQGVDEMGKMGEKLSQNTDTAMNRFTAAVTPTLAAMEKIASRADAMAQRTEDLEKALSQADGSRARMETVLRAQSELFYRFFMSANLPQYQKDALGDAYEKMNRLLTDSGDTENEAQTEPQ